MPASSNFNTTTLGGYAVHDPPRGVVGTNRLTMFTGGARPALGKMILARPDYDRLVDDLADGSTTLVMKGTPGPGIEMTVHVMGAVPVTVAASDDRGKDMVEVVIRDGRYKLDSYVNERFNCLKAPFRLGGGTTHAAADFVSGSLLAGAEYTWAQAITALELPALPANPSWKPRNLLFDGVPRGRVADAVAGQLHLVVGYNWRLAGEEKARINFNNPGGISATNDALFQKARRYVIGGQDALRNPIRLPDRFVVRFPAYDISSPGDSLSHREYTKTVMTGTGLSQHDQPLHVGGHIAIRQGSTAPLNQTELDAIAADIASRRLAFMQTDVSLWRISGLWPFTPDGAIRAVMWASEPPGPLNEGGAYTVLKFNNDEDFDQLADMRRTMDAVSNQLVVGIGSLNTSLEGGNGQRRVWDTAATNSFWAKITGNTSLADNRWKYAWTEQRRTSTAWEDKPSGRTGTTDTNFALNGLEAYNAASGVQGNGIDHDTDYPAGFEMQPIRGNPVVRMWEEVDKDGAVSYSFEASNAEQGACE